MGDQQSRRSAVLGCKCLSVVLIGNPSLTVEQILKWQVGAVTAVAVNEREVGFGLDVVEQRVEGDAAPDRIQLGPTRHAMDVDRDRLGRQSHELRPTPPIALALLRGDGELPRIERYARSWSGRKDREVVGEVLARRQLPATVPPPSLEAPAHGAHRASSLSSIRATQILSWHRANAGTGPRH